MRLHTLTITAFGPFPGTETIDFDEYDNAGILLIHGPTGSGKTSLLDAVTFALFGNVPGARRGLNNALRSDHASGSVAPRVELEFSVGAQRYRIERSPSWNAPKSRGTGTTPRNATVLLQERRDGQWRTMSTKIPDAAIQISDLLGMKIEQFSQVVLLPQGEFAQFLRAKPEERAVLLERLFDVSRFGRIEEWMVKQRQEAKSSLDALNARLATTTSTFTSAAGRFAERCEADGVTPLDAADVSLTEHPTDQLRARMDSVLAALNERHAQISRATNARKLAAVQARGAFQSAQHITEAASKYRQACAVLDNTSQADVDALHDQLERAQSAVRILRLSERSQAAQVTLSKAEADVARLQSQVYEASDLQSPGQDWVDSTTEEITQLSLAHQLATQVIAHEQTHTRARSVAARRAQELAEAEAEDAAATKELARAHEAFTAADESLSTATAPDAFSDALAALRDADESLETVRAAHRHATRLVEDAQRQELDAERASAQLHARHMSNLAAVLATQLREHDPCPVCGSVEHPSPASSGPEGVSDADLEAAEARVRAARTARAAAEREQARREEAVQNAEKLVTQHHTAVAAWTLAEGKELEEFERELRRAYEQLQQRRSKALAEQDAAQQAVHSTQQLLTRAQTNCETARQREVETADDLKQMQQSLTKQLLTLDGLDAASVRNDDPQAASSWADSIPARIAAKKQLLALVRELLTAQRHEEQAQSSWRMADAAVNEQITDSGFADLAQVQQEALTDGELLAAQQRWRQLNTEVTTALGTLKDPDVVAAAWVPVPNVAVLHDVAQAAEESSDRASQAHTVWTASLEALTTHRRDVVSVLDEMGPTMRAAQEISDLADTMTGTGENDRKMRLTSYVLAAYLETITDFANHRLRRMGQGRYRLKYSDDRVKGNSKSGLGLKVTDLWTGQTRDTASLSGGEAFMASLSLALGLGDAVRAESGGLELNTLFVDEGFGSLDQDTLEEVMSVLDELREGGRLVAIVSHVTELKARISARIEIEKTSNGSTVKKLATPVGV